MGDGEQFVDALNEEPDKPSAEKSLPKASQGPFPTSSSRGAFQSGFDQFKFAHGFAFPAKVASLRCFRQRNPIPPVLLVPSVLPVRMPPRVPEPHSRLRNAGTDPGKC